MMLGTANGAPVCQAHDVPACRDCRDMDLAHRASVIRWFGDGSLCLACSNVWSHTLESVPDEENHKLGCPYARTAGQWAKV